MKKLLLYTLIILSLFNGIYCMEEQSDSSLGNLGVLPPELIFKIIEMSLKDYAESLHDIVNFKVLLKAELDKIGTISKDFNVFKEKELMEFIKALKLNRYEHLTENIKAQYKDYSAEELNQTLVDLMHCNFSKESFEEAIKLIIAFEAVDIKLESGMTFLMVAAKEGHTEAVRLLIDNNADVNSINDLSETAMMLAADKGHLAIVRLLIAKGAEVEINGCKKSALLLAAQHGHKKIVKLLIKNGAAINFQDYYDRNALLWAAIGNHMETIKFLIKKGAMIDIKRADGWTALMIASRIGYIEMVKLLIGEGADVNITNDKGESALSLAIRGNFMEIKKILIENGAVQNNNLLGSCIFQ